MSGKAHTQTITEALRDAALILQPKKITCAVDKGVGRLEAEILLAHALKKNKVWLIANGQSSVISRAWKKFQAFVRRRLKHEPISYITGKKEFYGLLFEVNGHVLIPRPESEMLVELVLNHPHPLLSKEGRTKNPLLSKEGKGVVWDVGTGSGAIGIAIAKRFPNACVLATDNSAAALALAQNNAKRLNAKNVTFLRDNLYGPRVRRWLDRHTNGSRFTAHGSRLIITANLPYLPNRDKRKLDPDVVKYEPSSALFAGPTGRELIEKFLKQIFALDLHFSSLFLEFDPPQARKLVALTKHLFPHARVRTHRDLAGRQRVLEISS